MNPRHLAAMIAASWIVTLPVATQTVVAPEGGAPYPTRAAFLLTTAMIVAISLIALALALPKGAQAGAS